MLCRRRRKSAQTVDADTVHKPVRHALQPSQHSAVAAAADGRPAVLCRRTRGLRQPVAQHVASFAILKRRQGQGFAENQRRLCGGGGMFAIGTTSDCDASAPPTHSPPPTAKPSPTATRCRRQCSTDGCSPPTRLQTNGFR